MDVDEALAARQLRLIPVPSRACLSLNKDSSGLVLVRPRFNCDVIGPPFRLIRYDRYLCGRIFVSSETTRCTKISKISDGITFFNEFEERPKFLLR
jgi:hypothetical protein